MQCCTAFDHEFIVPTKPCLQTLPENVYTYDPFQFHAESYADMFLQQVRLHAKNEQNAEESTPLCQQQYELERFLVSDALELLTEEFGIVNVSEIAALLFENLDPQFYMTIDQFLRLSRVLFYADDYKQRPFLIFFYYCGAFNRQYALGSELFDVFRIAGQPRIQNKCYRHYYVEITRYMRWVDKLWVGAPLCFQVNYAIEYKADTKQGEYERFKRSFFGQLLTFDDSENRELELFVHNVFGSLEESAINLFVTRDSSTEY